MFDDGYRIERTICDWCYRKDFNAKARTKAPHVFDGDSFGWNLKIPAKKRKVDWALALENTYEEMTTKCVVFNVCDVGEAKLCFNCLKTVMDQLC